MREQAGLTRHKFILALILVAVIVLSSSVRTTASPQNQTETHTLWLPVAGSIPPCWVRDYGYSYRPDRFGDYFHRALAHVDPYFTQWQSGSVLLPVNAHYEIYADAEGQSLLRAGEMIDSRLPASFSHHWSPPGGLEEDKRYYIHVRAYCAGVYTPWTPLAEFEAFREGRQTFQP
ncbi:MAG: hypothetical protein WDZ49_08205 [Litorilinea sp.]